MTDLIDDLIHAWRGERPDLDPSGLAVVGRIIHLGQRMQMGASQALQSTGLAYTDFDIIATLRRSGDPYALTPKQLREAVLLSSGAMTAAIDRLDRANLVRRRPSETDRRSLLVCLTEAGKTLAERAAALRFAEAQSWTGQLTPAEAQHLIDLLRKLHAGPERGA